MSYEQHANEWHMIGRLTQDPRVMNKGETKLAFARIVTLTISKDATPKYFDLKGFSKTADIMATLGKGQTVSFKGTVEQRKVMIDGRETLIPDLVVRSVHTLTAIPKRADAPQPAPSSPPQPNYAEADFDDGNPFN